MSAPSIEYAELLPMLIVFGAAIVGVLIEAFAPRRPRHALQVGVALAALVAAFVQVVRLAGTSMVGAEGSVAIDGPALFLQGTILAMAAVSVMFFAERGIRKPDEHEGRQIARQIGLDLHDRSGKPEQGDCVGAAECHLEDSL